MTLWLDFLHLYFVALSALTVGSLTYLGWLLWPRPAGRNENLHQGVGTCAAEGVRAGTAP